MSLRSLTSSSSGGEACCTGCTLDSSLENNTKSFIPVLLHTVSSMEGVVRERKRKREREGLSGGRRTERQGGCEGEQRTGGRKEAKEVVLEREKLSGKRN